MKITKRQLQQLIQEVMDPAPGVELTEPGATEQAISAAWPDQVFYNGKSVFDTFYQGGAMDAVWSFIEREGYDEGQEAYLGYDPDLDVFVMGFDVWPEGGDQMEGLLIELRPDGTPMDVITSAPGGMYPQGRNEAKRAFPNIIDVRLD